MSIKPILDELFAMTFHAGIKPGLERITLLCQGLDNPQQRYPVVHLAGTNGKGSTASMLASILASAGYKVGLYTSPHVRLFNERIRIDGVMIGDDDVARLASPLMESARVIGGTFFEVTTAMAFQYFAERRVDVAIIETGLGGRLDATNIVTPILSIITQIDLDHQEYLGTTLPQIAGEKAGIIKPLVPCVVGHRDGLRSVFKTKAQEQNAPLSFVADEVHVEVDTIHPDFTMTVCVTRNDTLDYYTTDLCGQHQAQNVATVLASLPILRGLYFIDEEHVRNGLRSVRRSTGLFGRCELVSTDPYCVIDVSHNEGGIRALVNTLMGIGVPARSMQVVFGVMANKDATAMLAAIKPICAVLHVCSPVLVRSLTVEELALLAKSSGIENVEAHASVAEAIIAARRRGSTVICGSFHVADEAVVALSTI